MAPRRRGPWFVLGLVLVWAALTATLVQVGEAHLARLERNTIAEAMTQAESSATAIEQNLQRTFDGIASLQGLMETRQRLLETNPSAARAIEDHLAEFARSGRLEVLQIALIGRDGVTAWSSVPNFGRPWLGDREHFRVHAEGYRGVWVSAPIIGRVSGRWSVQITRAILDEAGDFAGVVVVSVDPISLSNSLSELQMHDHDTAVVLRAYDGALIARGRTADAQIGRAPNPEHPLLVAARQQPRGVLEYTAVVSGRPLVAAYIAIPNTPLVVGYAIDRGAELAGLAAVKEPVRIAIASTSACIGVVFGLLVAWRGRRAAAQSLRAVREHSAMLTDVQREIARLHAAMPAVIFHGVVSADGLYRQRYLSRSVEAITGWSEQAFQGGMLWEEICDPPDALFGIEPCMALLRDGTGRREFRLRRPDDSWISVRANIQVIARAEDGSAEVVGFMSDITRELELAAQAARSAKLASLGEVATGIAHELHQPLAVIMLAAENAQIAIERAQSAPLPDVIGKLQRIEEQAERAKVIIDHLRTFGHPSAGPVAAVDLATPLAAARLLTESALRSAGILLAIELPAGLPRVKATEVPLEQVLINIILNARDAFLKRPDDPPKTIRVTARATGSRVILEIADNAGGIAPAVLASLFEPFVTTKDVGSGTGLGLSISRGIMQSFGGEISARNERDGAVFVLDFEAAEATR